MFLERMGADYGPAGGNREGCRLTDRTVRPLMSSYTPRVKKLFGLPSEAKTMNNSHTSSEHVLLGLLVEGSGVAALS